MARSGLLFPLVSAAVSIALLQASSQAQEKPPGTTTPPPEPPEPEPPRRPSELPKFDRTIVERYTGRSGRKYIIKRVETDDTGQVEAFFDSHIGEGDGWIMWRERYGQRIEIAGGPDHNQDWPADNPTYKDIKADLGIRDKG